MSPQSWSRPLQGAGGSGGGDGTGGGDGGGGSDGGWSTIATTSANEGTGQLHPVECHW